jgi:hypothetical protein
MRRDPALVAAAMSLRADATTAEVVGALRGAGVRPILLKGPAFARLLYDTEPAARSYVDADLLVEQRLVPEAGRVLRALGFVDVEEDAPLPGCGRWTWHRWTCTRRSSAWERRR